LPKLAVLLFGAGLAGMGYALLFGRPGRAA
jgi:hypothetical protein